MSSTAGNVFFSIANFDFLEAHLKKTITPWQKTHSTVLARIMKLLAQDQLYMPYSVDAVHSLNTRACENFITVVTRAEAPGPATPDPTPATPTQPTTPTQPSTPDPTPTTQPTQPTTQPTQPTAQPTQPTAQPATPTQPMTTIVTRSRDRNHITWPHDEEWALTLPEDTPVPFRLRLVEYSVVADIRTITPTTSTFFIQESQEQVVAETMTPIVMPPGVYDEQSLVTVLESALNEQAVRNHYRVAMVGKCLAITAIAKQPQNEVFLNLIFGLDGIYVDASAGPVLGWGPLIYSNATRYVAPHSPDLTIVAGTFELVMGDKTLRCQSCVPRVWSRSADAVALGQDSSMASSIVMAESCVCDQDLGEFSDHAITIRLIGKVTGGHWLRLKMTPSQIQPPE